MLDLAAHTRYGLPHPLSCTIRVVPAHSDASFPSTWNVVFSEPRIHLASSVPRRHGFIQIRCTASSGFVPDFPTTFVDRELPLSLRSFPALRDWFSCPGFDPGSPSNSKGVRDGLKPDASPSNHDRKWRWRMCACACDKACPSRSRRWCWHWR